MKIVVAGSGKVGNALCRQLSKEGHDIVVIDKNKNVLREARHTLDIGVVYGNGASLQTQKSAHVGSSDLFIAATSADETNLLCCIMAKKAGCPNAIARVRNPEYYEQLFMMKEELGISMMVNPEYSAANEISRLLQFPSFLKRDSFAKGRVEIVELVLKQNSPLCGVKLSELYNIAKVKVLVCAVEHNNTVSIPDGNFILQQGDKVFVTASTTDLAQLLRNIGLTQRKIKNALIIGGSRIAYYLTKNLIKAGVEVKIIESNEQRCRELADDLPKATIIHADGSDRYILDSEGLKDADAVITLTNIDEENLIISMYANYLGTHKVITKINRTEYNEVLKNTGIDCVISPKELCCNDIVRYVRAMGNRKGDSVITLHRILSGHVEALEFYVPENMAQTGKKLSELSLKPNTLIACINRAGKLIIPTGNDTIEPKDTIIVVAMADRVIDELEDIFIN